MCLYKHDDQERGKHERRLLLPLKIKFPLIAIKCLFLSYVYYYKLYKVLDFKFYRALIRYN